MPDHLNSQQIVKFNRRNTTLFALLVAGILCSGSLIGCDRDASKNADSQSATTSPENGEAANNKKPAEQIKITFAFQPQENPDGMQLDVKKFADFISKQTGYETEVFLPTSYAAVVEALRGKNADVAYFSAWPYMIAHEKANAEILVAEERRGQPFYYSQWYSLKDGPIKELADLKGKTIAFTSPTSTSGYLFPFSKIIEEGLLPVGGEPRDFFGEVLFAGGYQQAVLALVNGKVEAAAASDYALMQYLTEEQRERVHVVSKQGPVPTHLLAIRGDLPQEVKDNVRKALLELNKDENKDLLKSVYGAEKLVERTHEEHVGALEQALKRVSADYPMK